MKLKTTKYLFGILMLLTAAGCGNDEPTAEREDFDRAAMLENYAVNVIRPAYENLLDEVEDLADHWQVLLDVRDEDNLNVLRDQWQEAAGSWQSANAFNFGPAGEEGLRKGLVEEIGTFPADVDRIEELITAGDATLNNFDRDTRGFPAVEYLLFRTGEDWQAGVQELMEPNRRAYLSALIDHLRSEVERVVNGWASYQSEFIANDGTDVGSATSQLYNEFVRSYEAAKNFKVALPAGKRAGQSQSEPQRVEAFYSGHSLALLQAHLEAIERIYYGRGAASGDGIGFYEYLQSVEGGPALISATEAQWQSVKNALAQVPRDRPFSALIEDNDPTVDILNTELQKQVRFFKSDLSSLLGIAITFNSGDGD